MWISRDRWLEVVTREWGVRMRKEWKLKQRIISSQCDTSGPSRAKLKNIIDNKEPLQDLPENWSMTMELYVYFHKQAEYHSIKT